MQPVVATALCLGFLTCAACGVLALVCGAVQVPSFPAAAFILAACGGAFGAGFFFCMQSVVVPLDRARRRGGE